MYIKTQKFLVLGVSKSGSSSAKLILRRGGTCYLYEDLNIKKVENSISELENLGAKRINENEIDEILPVIDVVVISPGVAINHFVAVRAKQLKKKIIGEMEFGFLATFPTVIGVTGTNGKTTTVSLLNDIFKLAQIKCETVGNIGIPVSSRADDIDKDTVCITEVSSFQLESVNAFCPHVACVLNITPDHLERHYSMENYVYLKKRILKNQRESEFSVLNYDDERVREFAGECESKVIFVSLKERVNGAYSLGGKIYFNDEYLLDEKDLPIKGEHNVYDVCFAIAVGKIFGIENSIIKEAIINFKGVKHRMELVLEKEGVKYYNDSKATNTSSTVNAIKSISTPKILIVGGSEKGENYVDLFNEIKNNDVKHVIITGDSSKNMLKDAISAEFYSFTVVEDFLFAVKLASLMANEGDAVLLSPACASFDKFSGYEERGDAFVNAVNSL